MDSCSEAGEVGPDVDAGDDGSVPESIADEADSNDEPGSGDIDASRAEGRYMAKDMFGGVHGGVVDDIGTMTEGAGRGGENNLSLATWFEETVWCGRGDV